MTDQGRPKQVPLLAVERDASTVKAVFFTPGTPWAEQPRCIFPIGPDKPLFDPSLWQSLAKMTGLPRPEILLSACVEGLDDPDEGARSLAGRREFWRGLFEEADGKGVDLAGLITVDPPLHWKKLTRLKALAGGPVCDTFCARLLGLMARPERLERSYRHGLCCLYLDRFFTCAYLVFRGRLFGVLELPKRGLTVQDLLEDLEEFRLGWLPLERAEQKGGLSFVDVNLPAEAEGFRPLFAIGPKARTLEGQAKILSSDGGGVFWGCFGLLHKYSFVHTP